MQYGDQEHAGQQVHLQEEVDPTTQNRRIRGEMNTQSGHTEVNDSRVKKGNHESHGETEWQQYQSMANNLPALEREAADQCREQWYRQGPDSEMYRITKQEKQRRFVRLQCGRTLHNRENHDDAHPCRQEQ